MAKSAEKPAESTAEDQALVPQNGGTDLVDMQEQIKKELATMKDTVAAPPSRNISAKGKVFTLPDGTTDKGPMTVVILDHRNFNRWYREPYNAQNPKPPTCFALNKVIDGLAPHGEAKEPQHETCAGCELNKWKSAPNGRGKACRNTVRLAVVPVDATEDTEPMILGVSPTALKSWNTLVANLEQQGRIPVQAVVEVSIDPLPDYPTLLFKAIGEHSNLNLFWQLRQKAQMMLDQPPLMDE